MPLMVVLVPLVLGLPMPTFNYTTCPAANEVWSWNNTDPTKVPSTFDVLKFAPKYPSPGIQYYELAFHDWTQKPACPWAKCVGSFKQFDPVKNIINDTFTATCASDSFVVPLRFNVTKQNGVLGGFVGYAKLFPKQEPWIPDMIVDFKPTADGTGYDWVIEMQCVQKSNHVYFIGINFYSRQREPGSDYINAMLDAARARGLDGYMKSGEGLTIVPQTNCTQLSVDDQLTEQ